MLSAIAVAMPIVLASAAHGEPVASWQGSYVGLGVGAHIGSARYNFAATGESGTVHPSGITGSIFGGHLWQSERWLYGAEIGFTGTSSSESTTTPSGITFRQRNNWTADLRGIVGHSYGDWMAYVFGGLAYGSLTHSATNVAGGWKNTEKRTGWTAGVGAQRRITENLSIRLDYAYTDLGTEMCIIAPPPAPPLPGMPTVRDHSSEITGGLVLHF
jgi:outer membrane immunogenic protein